MSYVILDFKRSIIEAVEEVVGDAEFEIEIPPEKKGDFALPCYSLASEFQKDPKLIAEDIASQIELENGTVECAGPYLNFTIDESHLAEKTIENTLEKREDYGSMPSKDKKMIVEHTSANPNGPLHVGRARNPIIGDTIARIHEKIGYEVEKQYYVNDIGRQMAILTWGKVNLDEEELSKPQREKEDHKLVRYYQETSRMLEDDERIENEIKDMINSMEKGDEKIFSSLKENSKRVMGGIIESLERLNVHIDSFKNESDFIEDGSVQEVIETVSGLDEAGEEEGALYYEIDEDNRTFITREDGTNLYPARDIAYHIWKAERSDELIDILGEDHKQHGKFMRKILETLEVQPVPEIVFHSFVTFEGKEMSTRKGTYVTLDEFMDTAEQKAKEEILKRREDLREEEVEEIAEKVGISAVRYNVLKVQPSKSIDFRWEEALNFQGSSAPFVQYGYTRANGILEKAEEEVKEEVLNFKELEEGEIRLLKKIAEYPQILKRAADDKAPHKLARYSHELAAEFNQFYRDYPVLDAEKSSHERLTIVKSFKSTMKSVLETLGMKKPRKM